MWSCSAKNKVTGKFTVVVFDWNGAESFRGEFDDMNETDRAGQREERRASMVPADDLGAIATMTDDELLAALFD